MSPSAKSELSSVWSSLTRRMVESKSEMSRKDTTRNLRGFQREDKWGGGKKIEVFEKERKKIEEAKRKKRSLRLVSV